MTVDASQEQPYITAAMTAGILKDGDFEKYTGYITRTDAAVLLNRADEYLYGDTIDADLLEVVLEKRISDIKKVTESKREAVAKCFVKGIIQGNSNGYYIQNRSFKGSEYLTKTDAKALIKKAINKSKRAIKYV